jgi:drug/metabolite transporter (DMT)-like permease
LETWSRHEIESQLEDYHEGRWSVNTAIWAGMIAVYIVWGSTYLAIRFGVESIPPFLMAGARFLIAGGCCISCGVPSPKTHLQLALSGARQPSSVFLLVGGNGIVSWAEQHVPSGSRL